MTEEIDRSWSEWLAVLVDVAGAESAVTAAELALRGVNAMLGFDRAALLRIEGESLDVYASTFEPDVDQKRGLAPHLIDTARSSGVVTLPAADETLLCQIGIAAGSALAVHADGVHWGVLMVGHSSAPVDEAAALPALTESMLESLVSTLGTAIGRDEITKRLEESNRRLETYAHAAAHDLRSPLRRIRSFSQILQARLAVEEIDRVQLDDFAERIANGAERLDALLSSMLEHTSTDAIAGEPHEYTDLHAVATHICNGVSELSHAPEPTFLIADLPEVRLPADAAERVLRNVIDHAMKYSPPDRAADIEITSQAFPGGIRVRVSDNGEGIDPRFASEVFQRFNQLNDQTDRWGVALAVVEQLLASRGAKIWLEPGAGAGATFVMEFPVSAVRPAPVVRPVTTDGDAGQAASV